MRKKIVGAVPYLLGLIYLIDSLLNIEYWVAMHIGYDGAVLLPFAIALIVSVILLMLRVFKKKKYNFCFPVFLLVIGMIINIVGSRIPCCSGG